jgi:DNA repair protein RadD
MNTPKLVGDIVSHWIKHGEDRPTVVFAVSIKHSKYIANIFKQNGIPSDTLTVKCQK